MSNGANGNGVTSSGVVQSVDRAVTVLEILAKQPWSGVTEVAQELGTHKSTVFRLLSTLERRGMVEQHAETQKYRLGFGVVRLAGAVRSELDLPRFARPVCEELSLATDENVTLAVLDGQDVVNIDHVNMSTSLVSVNWQGRRTELHTTSNGKVFMAWMPEATRERLLGQPLATATVHTRSDPEDLRRHLAQVRSDGYALSIEELEIGLHAVAAPIWGADGQVIASVSVSGPSYRLPAERLVDVAKQTVEAADEISRRLGYVRG